MLLSAKALQREEGKGWQRTHVLSPRSKGEPFSWDQDRALAQQGEELPQLASWASIAALPLRSPHFTEEKQQCRGTEFWTTIREVQIYLHPVSALI